MVWFDLLLLSLAHFGSSSVKFVFVQYGLFWLALVPYGFLWFGLARFTLAKFGSYFVAVMLSLSLFNMVFLGLLWFE